MQKKEVFFKTDFAVTEQCETGYSMRFRFHYFTSNLHRDYVASFDGEKYENCRLNEDGTLTVTFDDHRLGIGDLMVERHYYLDDERFRTGQCDMVVSAKPVLQFDKDAAEGERISQVVLTPDGAEDFECLSVVEPYWMYGGFGEAAYRNEEERKKNELERQAAENARKEEWTAWAAWYGQIKTDASQWFSSTKAAWDNWYSDTKLDWTVWYDTARGNFNHWFDSAQETWTSWFPGVSEAWTVFKSDAEQWWTAWKVKVTAEWSAIVQDWNTLKADVNTGVENANAATDAANAAKEAADTARDNAIAATGLCKDATEKAKTATEESKIQTNKCADATALAEELNAHPQMQGENGNWWKWNTETNEYEDTGIIARGGGMYPMVRSRRNHIIWYDSTDGFKERIVRRRNHTVIKL